MDHDRTAPDHPDVEVSESMAICLIAAAEQHDLSILRHALALATEISCWRDVVDTVAIHGGARLRHLREEHGVEQVQVGPWLFHTQEVAGDVFWSYSLSQPDMQAIMDGTQQMMPGAAPNWDVLKADLHGVARTVIAAANGADEDEVLSFWEAPEAKSMAQVARLAACVGLMFGTPEERAMRFDD